MNHTSQSLNKQLMNRFILISLFIISSTILSGCSLWSDVEDSVKNTHGQIQGTMEQIQQTKNSINNTVNEIQETGQSVKQKIDDANNALNQVGEAYDSAKNLAE